MDDCRNEQWKITISKWMIERGVFWFILRTGTCSYDSMSISRISPMKFQTFTASKSPLKLKVLDAYKNELKFTKKLNEWARSGSVHTHDRAYLKKVTIWKWMIERAVFRFIYVALITVYVRPRVRTWEFRSSYAMEFKCWMLTKMRKNVTMKLNDCGASVSVY